MAKYPVRLNPTSGNNKLQQQQQQKYGQGRLEVWSAVKDSWIPVCGINWSHQTNSQEACQVLGYSRASKTQILFEQITSKQGQLQMETTTTTATTINGRLNHNRTLLGIETDGNTSDTRLATLRLLSYGNNSSNQKLAPIIANKSLITTFNDSTSPIVYEDTATLSPKSHSGTWFQAMASSSKGSDHLVVYDRSPTTSGNNNPLLTGAGVKSSGNNKAVDLSNIYATCVSPELQHVSYVNLECQNFQCGRAITSYTSRVRLQQQQQQQQALIGDASERLQPASRSFVLAPQAEEVVPNSQFGSERIKEINTEDERSTFLNETVLIENQAESKLASGVPLQVSPISSRLVVGGTEIWPGEWPYIAAIHGGPDEVFFCGGVLISMNWLLTAAHCVGNRTQPDGWMVKVGVTRRIASPAFLKKLKVRKIIKHPKFNDKSLFNNDIALILLEESVEFNQYLRPICLPKANLKLEPQTCVIVGFGKPRFSSEANYLQVAHFVNVPIVRHSTCSDWYAEQGVNLTEGMLCAGYAEGKRDACQVSSQFLTNQYCEAIRIGISKFAQF